MHDLVQGRWWRINARKHFILFYAFLCNTYNVTVRLMNALEVLFIVSSSYLM